MAQITTTEIKKEVGFVVRAQDYLLYLEGLPTAKINDVIVSPGGGRALVTGLEKEKIEALMLDRERPGPGTPFNLAKTGLSLPLESNLFGRAINPLGQPIDDKGNFPPVTTPIDLDVVAPGIADREIITDQLYTGITMVDTLIPIGRGQRELLFGEPRSGKAPFLLDIIVNQKGQNRICVYNPIGRADIDVLRFYKSFLEAGSGDYTIMVAATSSDAAPLISIAPAVACSVAEYYRNKGADVLLIFDDLGTHSKYLREIALLSGRIPGRESYPADIFYQHSHLVERAGNFNKNKGGGSITLLPVIETDIENFTNLIPTNVMSMTDGHILFSAALRAQGIYPAIEADRSVTRVGHQTQKHLQKVVSDTIRSLLANFHELERYGQFGSELTSDTQMAIKRGLAAQELLKQESGQHINHNVQLLLLTLIFTTFLNEKDIEFLRKNKASIIAALTEHTVFKEIAKKLDQTQFEDLVKILDKNLKILNEVCKD
jgi:F-type H+-transporting ATPase subunit alpha